MKTIILIQLFCAPMFLFSQINYDTVYTKTIGNPSFHTEGLSLVEISADSILLSTGYYGGIIYCDWRPKLYYTDSNGDTISSITSIPGNGKIVKTYDGNFANTRAIKNTSNCSLDTILISKFDNNGDTVWTNKQYFGICNNRVSDIVQTTDSGFAVTGFFSITSCGVPFYNTFLLKLDKYGIEEWVKFYGTSTYMQEGISLVQTTDEGYAILSYSPYSTYNILRTNPLGDTLWTCSISDPNMVSGRGDIDLLPGNQFLVTGMLDTSGFLAKIDSLGNVLNIYSYSQLVTGNAVIIQNVKYLENEKAYLFISDKFVLTDTSGNILWTGLDFDATFKDVIQTSNGDLIGIGYKYTGGTEKIFMVRYTITVCTSTSSTINETACNSYTSPSGDYTWITSNTYMDTIPNTSGCDSIITINLIINIVDTSVTASDSILTSNASGATYQWVDCNNGNVPIAGETNQSFTATGNGSYAVIVNENVCSDTSACYSITTIGILENTFGELIQVCPNPTSGNLTIVMGKRYNNVVLKIRNIAGQVISNNNFGDVSSLTFDIEGTNGIYFIDLNTAEEKIVTIKVLKN